MDCSSRETPGGGVITPLLRKERQVLCHLSPIPLSFVPLTHILRWCAPAFTSGMYVRQSGLPLWANAGEQISLLCCAHMRLTVKWHWLHISASVINEYRKCSSSKQLITGRTDSGITWQLKRERERGGGWWNEMHWCSQKDCAAFKEWLSLCWWVSVISGYFASFAWRSVNVHIEQVWTKYKPMPPKCSGSQPRDLALSFL